MTISDLFSAPDGAGFGGHSADWLKTALTESLAGRKTALREIEADPVLHLRVMAALAMMVNQRNAAYQVARHNRVDAPTLLAGWIDKQTPAMRGATELLQSFGIEPADIPVPPTFPNSTAPS